MQIIHRYSSKVLHEDAAATVKESVIAALAARADLSGADLSGAYLSGAYLSGADLSGAYLSGADLSGAYLRGADLSGAYLRGLGKVAWQSHDLIAEILRLAAEASDDEDDHGVLLVDRLKFAGLVLLKRDWCWPTFLRLADTQLPWALGVLAKWIQPDDDHHSCLDAYRVVEEAPTPVVEETPVVEGQASS